MSSAAECLQRTPLSVLHMDEVQNDYVHQRYVQSFETARDVVGKPAVCVSYSSGLRSSRRPNGELLIGVAGEFQLDFGRSCSGPELRLSKSETDDQLR